MRNGLVFGVFVLCACGGPDIPEYGGRTLEEWIERAEGPSVGPAHTVDEQRENAIAMLAEIGAPAASALGGMVKNQDRRISGAAVEALRQIGPGAKPAVADLISGLTQQRIPEVRRSIPGALVAIAPQSEAVQLALLNRLKDPDDRMFTSAWSALKLCFGNEGPVSERVGRRLGALRQAGLSETRQQMIRGLPGAAKHGWKTPR